MSNSTLIKELVKAEKKNQKQTDLISDLRKKNKFLLRQEISLEEAFNENNKPFKFKKINLTKINKLNQENQTNGVCLLLSDIHINKVVSGKTINDGYNMNHLNKRIKQIIQEVLIYPYKSKNLNIFLAGDILEGIIHNGHMKGPMSITESIEYMVNMILEMVDNLSVKFNKINLHCVLGNHSRITEKVEASGRKHEDFETMAYNTIAREFKNKPNFSINVSTNGYLLVPINKKKIFVLHGDQDRGLTYNLNSAVKLQNKCRAIFNSDFNHAIWGHNHNFGTCESGNGGTCIQNGSVPGVDEYALQNGFTLASASQTLFFVNSKGNISNVNQIILDDIKIKD